MEIVNALNRFDKIEFVQQGGSSIFVPATYDYFMPGDGQHAHNRTRKENGWWRTSCKSWQERKTQLEYWEKRGVPTFEGDVGPVRRYLVDHPDTKIAKPRGLYLDFEADSRRTFFEHTTGRSRVLCWTIKEKGSPGYVHEMLQTDSDHDEACLMSKLWDHIQHYDQLLAWNGGMVEGDIIKSDKAKHGFDYYVLIRRSLKLGVLPRWWRRILYLDHLAVYKRNNMNSGDRSEKTSFSLENIGQARCGRGKTDFDANETWEYWVAGGRKRELLSEYNIADVELEADIEKATDYTSVFQSLCEVTWCFPDTVHLQPSKQVDGMMLCYGNRKGVHFHTKKTVVVDENKESFAGAYCDGPYVHGITENVHVADFKSLYPSIMVSCNISPELLDLPGTTCPVDAESLQKYGVDGKITFDNTTLGILPECVLDNIALREEWKQKAKKYPKGSPEEKEASCKSMAYKMANNSYMGVACSEYSRYFSVKLGLAICRTGVTLIQAARKEAENRGWKVIYIDTDSLFVVGPKTADEFKEFTTWCNEHLFPRLASEWGCRTNSFFLDYEKAFSKVLFTYDHKKRKYNRKKYVYRLAHKGFTPPKAGSEVDAVGIESQRGDSNKLAVDLQERVINRIMSPDGCGPEEIYKIVEDFRIQVLHMEHPVEDVLISKAIRKTAESYGDKKMPHLAAARMLEKKGREVREGTKVQYVITCGSKSHPKYKGDQEVVLAEDYTGELDRYFLWESMIYPGTYRILRAAFPGDTRFDKFCEPNGKAAKYVRRERAGQIRMFE